MRDKLKLLNSFFDMDKIGIIELLIIIMIKDEGELFFETKNVLM